MDAIDRERLLAVSGNDIEEAKILMQMEVDSVKEILERLAGSRESGDTGAVKDDLHELRGSASNVGAEEIATLVRAIESALPSAPGSNITEAQCAELAGALERLETATKAFR